MRVLLVGYFGAGNAGDDAFVTVAHDYLTRRFDRAEVWVAARRNWGRKLLGCRTIPFVPKLYRTQLRHLVARCDALLFAGGATLHTAHQMDLWSELLGRYPSCRAAALGVSIGPFSVSANEEACKRLLSKLKYVGLRDVQSHKLVSGWSELPESTHIELTQDLGVQMRRLVRAAPVPQAHASGRVLGVSLRPHESLGHGDPAVEQARVDFIALVVRRLLTAGEFDGVNLISLNSNRRLGDRIALNALAGRLGDSGQIVYRPYKGNPTKVLEEIQDVDVMLAMRLHAAVFAYITEVPCVRLSYNKKCDAWAESVGAAHAIDHRTQSVSDACSVVNSAVRDGLTGITPVSATLERSMGNWLGLERSGVL